MKKFDKMVKGLLMLSLIGLFASCSGEDNQETADVLSELESIGKEDLIERPF